MAIFFRRLLLWTIVCSISAAPSFYVAASMAKFDVRAMGIVVAIFILIYTAITTTDGFARFHAKPFIRRTLYIGYGLRILLSLAFPVGMGADMLPGMMSVALVEKFGVEPESFEGTFAITCVQGGMLNVILFVLMSIIYAFQRAFMRPPVEPQGFQVLTATPVHSPVPVAVQPIDERP